MEVYGDEDAFCTEVFSSSFFVFLTLKKKNIAKGNPLKWKNFGYHFFDIIRILSYENIVKL